MPRIITTPGAREPRGSSQPQAFANLHDVAAWFLQVARLGTDAAVMGRRRDRFEAGRNGIGPRGLNVVCVVEHRRDGRTVAIHERRLGLGGGGGQDADALALAVGVIDEVDQTVVVAAGIVYDPL